MAQRSAPRFGGAAGFGDLPSGIPPLATCAGADKSERVRQQHRQPAADLLGVAGSRRPDRPGLAQLGRPCVLLRGGGPSLRWEEKSNVQTGSSPVASSRAAKAAKNPRDYPAREVHQRAQCDRADNSDPKTLEIVISPVRVRLAVIDRERVGHSARVHMLPTNQRRCQPLSLASLLAIEVRYPTNVRDCH
jgi:hypothetical protein